ncbi:hypothetical protein RF400_12915, partial [Acinetobacter baumannii]|nr:hypothetical protein [Acinetobacter baumannii]
MRTRAGQVHLTEDGKPKGCTEQAARQEDGRLLVLPDAPQVRELTPPQSAARINQMNARPLQQPERQTAHG